LAAKIYDTQLAMIYIIFYIIIFQKQQIYLLKFSMESK